MKKSSNRGRKFVLSLALAVSALALAPAPAHASQWDYEAFHCIQQGTSDPDSCDARTNLRRVISRLDPAPWNLFATFEAYGERVIVTTGGMGQWRWRLHIEGRGYLAWNAQPSSVSCIEWAVNHNSDCKPIAGFNIAEGKDILIQVSAWDTDKGAWVNSWQAQGVS